MAGLISVVASTSAANASSPRWAHQLGTAGNDYATAIAVNAAGDSYITGLTEGTLPGSPEANAGGEDVFIAKYSPTGSRLWIHELGSANDDVGNGIATDQAGNAYITGSTGGRLPGSPVAAAGLSDVFVAKYSTNGTREWVRQLGTSATDVGSGIAVDSSGNLFVSGWTNSRLPGEAEPNAGGYDGFIAKYTTAGSRVWVQRVGGAGADYGTGIGVSGAGNVYVTGYTSYTIPGAPESHAGTAGIADAFVAKYNTSGKQIWAHLLGSPQSDKAYGVAVDHSGNAFITGYTNGVLPGAPGANAGSSDIFVAQYSEKGVKGWVRELGSPGSDVGNGVAVDSSGNAYVAGVATGHLPTAPEPFVGSLDSFVAKYSPTGTRLTVDELSASIAYGIGTDSAANPYIAGAANGHVPGAPEAPAGEGDVFIARFP